MKQVHYNIDDITKIDATYNLIYGEKSNGKSYQVKHKKAILHYLETGKRFILLRRWKEDITSLWIEQYFSDVDIVSITNGRYNSITVYRKVIYFSNIKEDGKVVRGEKIGYAMSLSTEQHFSGGSFLDVDNIIFEEFMERGQYLNNEPYKLAVFYSTIDRKRGTTKVWMVGNTISRVCPYLEDWNLQEVVRKQKQGTIETIKIDNIDNTVTLALEYCKSSGGKSMAIGNGAGMIDGGNWQAFPQPKLPKSYKCYKKLYMFMFQYQSFKFICELLQDTEEKQNKCWFIKPYSGEIKDKIIVFSDKVKISKYWFTDIYNMKIRNKKLENLFKTFTENNIFYSDDLTGTDFKQSINFQIRR